MNNLDRSGIMAGGNWCVDCVKVIDSYPQLDALGLILSEKRSNGGGPYNLLKDLAKLGADFSLIGIGLLGDDENGRYIIEECRALGIDISQMILTPNTPTSYTDVMSVDSSARRSFFHQKGANALLAENHFNFDDTKAKIFHLAYINLLDSLEKTCGDGSAGATNVLRRAKEADLQTSVDLVSFPRDDFSETVKPSMPYIDTLFLNELEATWLTGLELKTESGILPAIVKKALGIIFDMGVKQRVVMHFPEGAMVLENGGQIMGQGSIRIPEKKIAGATGAGDAFAAGFLYGLHQEWSMNRCLELGVCAAASCLFDSTTSNGILPLDACLELGHKFGFRNITH